MPLERDTMKSLWMAATPRPRRQPTNGTSDARLVRRRAHAVRAAGTRAVYFCFFALNVPLTVVASFLRSIVPSTSSAVLFVSSSVPS